MKDYIATAEALLADMRTHTAEWDWLREHIMPSAQAAADLDENPRAERRRKHSTVACESLHLLAGAHVMYITPTGQQWFTLESGKKGTPEKKDRYESWFARATEITHRKLAESNFYTVIHQCFLDRCLTGTGCVYCEALPDKKLNFDYIPTGTYAIADGIDGRVNTLAREFKLTASEAFEKFGDKWHLMPERVREAYDDPKRVAEKHRYVHLVIPRRNYTHGTDFIADPLRMRFASVYICWENEKVIISESGYNEFPYLVTRFMRYGESPYGYAPGSSVKEEISSVLKLENLMDVLGETAAYPRYLMLAEHVGEVDLRAGGRTVIKPSAAGMNMPREWMTGGRYDIGKDRIEEKENKIRSAYFVPMLQVISPIERPMTATEVNAREGERVLAFTPSMSLFCSDFNPFLDRIFCVNYRLGEYPQQDAPDDFKVKSVEGGENYQVKLPSVSYNGKISQAIDRAQRGSADAYILAAISVSQATGNTAMLDIVDWNSYGKWYYKSTGAPTDCMLSDADLEELNTKRNNAENNMQQLAELQGAGKAARDFSAATKP